MDTSLNVSASSKSEELDSLTKQIECGDIFGIELFIKADIISQSLLVEAINTYYNSLYPGFNIYQLGVQQKIEMLDKLVNYVLSYGFIDDYHTDKLLQSLNSLLKFESESSGLGVESRKKLIQILSNILVDKSDFDDKYFYLLFLTGDDEFTMEKILLWLEYKYTYFVIAAINIAPICHVQKYIEFAYHKTIGSDKHFDVFFKIYYNIFGMTITPPDKENDDIISSLTNLVEEILHENIRLSYHNKDRVDLLELFYNVGNMDTNFDAHLDNFIDLIYPILIEWNIVFDEAETYALVDLYEPVSRFQKYKSILTFNEEIKTVRYDVNILTPNHIRNGLHIKKYNEAVDNIQKIDI